MTYVVDTARDRRGLGIAGDHAYWVSALRLRSRAHTISNGVPVGQIDAVSGRFGAADPAPSATQHAPGTLTGGNLGPLVYLSSTKTWGVTPSSARSDSIGISAANIASAAIDVRRAHVDCRVALHAVSLDGALTVTLPGCHRVVHL